MKSLKTKVLMSALVLVFALIATIGTTYAWFTLSENVAVTGINITVNTEEALLVRVWNEDGAAVSGYTEDDFFNSVTILDPDGDGTESGYYKTGLETTGWKLTPVTAVAGETDNDTNYLSLDTPANANSEDGGYLQVKFWMITLSAEASRQVQISSLTVDSTNTNLEKTMYVGTVDEDTVKTIYAGVPEATDYTFTFGEGEPGYSSADTDLNSIETPSGLRSAVDTVNSDVVVATLASGLAGVELVTVNIWIEGWDPLSTNSIMGDSVTVDLTFSLIALP